MTGASLLIPILDLMIYCIPAFSLEISHTRSPANWLAALLTNGYCWLITDGFYLFIYFMNEIRNTAIAYLYLVKIYLLAIYKKREFLGGEQGGCLVFCLSIKSRDQVDAIYVYLFTSPNCLHYVTRIE